MINAIIIRSESLPLNHGVGTYINMVIKGLSREPGIDVHVVDLNTSTPEFHVLSVDDVRYYKFPPPVVVSVLRGEGENKLYVTRVADILMEYLGDSNHKNVVHINYSGLYFVGEVFKQKLSSKIVSTIHSIDWKFLYSVNRDRFHECYAIDGVTKRGSVSEDKLLSVSDKVIFVTQYGHDHYEEIYGRHKLSDASVMYNGVQIKSDSFPAEKTKSAFKKKLGFPQNSVLLLFVGRLTDEKGVFALIRSFKQIASKFPDAKLVIAGDGNFRECHQLSFGNWGQIIFTGHLKEQELEQLYFCADIGLIPSLFEQCSYVAIEMMLNNIPLIVSDVDGLSEIFEDEITALKVPLMPDIRLEPTIDEQAWSAAMSGLISDERKRTELANNCKDLIYHKFNNEDVISRISTIFEEI